MRIDDILNARPAEPLGSSKVYANQEEEAGTYAPASWGSDTARFSEEALAAQQAAAKQKEDAAGSAEAAKKDEATEAFSAYMRKAKGEAGSDPVESLQQRLKALQNQLAQVAQNQSMPEDAKNSMTTSLHAQIAEVAAQIAEAKMAEGNAA